MSSVLTPERTRDTLKLIELIDNALDETEHLWCWCKDELTLCGMYKAADDEEFMEDEDYEPNCMDCKNITHCFYCGCEVGNVTCVICVPKLNEWMAKHP